MASLENIQIDLSRLGRLIESQVTVDFALVFGSASHGFVKAGSDLDLAVWFRESNTAKLERYAGCVGQVEDTFGIPCDLTVLNTSGVVLRHEALKGQVLYIRPGLEASYAEFYTKTCADYEDVMFWRTRQLAYRGYA